MKTLSHLCLSSLLTFAVSTSTAQEAPQPQVLSWSAAVSDQYKLASDQTYGFFGGTAVKLDVWQSISGDSVPTVVYFHGGGWFFGNRTGATPYLAPWLARGWNVVNVEYRMAGNGLAPAAVEDARCALRWVTRNAKELGLDAKRIIVTGHSAGGHLALMVGMLNEADGFDNNCPADTALGEEPLHVSAVVDWYGPTDVADLLEGANRRTYAVEWLGGQPNRVQVAVRSSPLTYARPGLPPILMLHGDRDSVVPVEQSERLHEKLNASKDTNELYVVPGGGHGQFGFVADVEAYERVWHFLEQNVPSLPKRAPSIK